MSSLDTYMPRPCFTIVVLPSKCSRFYTLQLQRKDDGRDVIVFDCQFQVSPEGAIGKAMRPRLEVTTDIWTKDNYIETARGLLSFFWKTKEAYSTKYTEAWHLKSNSVRKVYKMYDCSRAFVVWNATH